MKHIKILIATALMLSANFMGKAQTGHRNADGKCINTRGDCQYQLNLESQGVHGGMVVIAFEIFLDHLAANKDKQTKGNPVVDGF